MSDEGRHGASVGADDLTGRIAGYAAHPSVQLGESLDFHVSTAPAIAFKVEIYRLGDYGGLGARWMAESPTLAGVRQAGPVTDPDTGMISCAWTPSWTLQVPQTWTSGAYLATFTTEDGQRSLTPFAVRDDARKSDFLVVLPFSTYQAYNQWPLNGKVGKSLYYGYGRDGVRTPLRWRAATSGSTSTGSPSATGTGLGPFASAGRTPAWGCRNASTWTISFSSGPSAAATTSATPRASICSSAGSTRRSIGPWSSPDTTSTGPAK